MKEAAQLQYMKAFICSLSPCTGLGKHLLTPGAGKSHRGGHQQGCSEQCTGTAGGPLGYCSNDNHQCCNSSAWKRKGEIALCGCREQLPKPWVRSRFPGAKLWGPCPHPCHPMGTAQEWDVLLRMDARCEQRAEPPPLPTPVPAPAAVAQQLAPTRSAFVYSDAFHRVAG